MYVKAVMIALAALALATAAAEAKSKHRHHYRHHHHHHWVGYGAHYNAYSRSNLWGDRCTTDEGYGRRLPCEYSGK
jgi:hypothetical protein